MATVASYILRDTLANRPGDNASGTEGRLFQASDTGNLYRDNGTTWDLIASLAAAPAFGAAATKTLASGVATLGSDRNIAIAAQSGTADDLIELSGLSVGDSVIIYADTGDTITVKHDDAGATDKILLSGAADYALTGNQTLILTKIAAGKVVQAVDQNSGGGGGGSTITVDSFANRPTSPSSGDAFLPTDGYGVQAYDGTNWLKFGVGPKFVKPNTSGFSWTNQGSATVTDSKDVLFFEIPGVSGGGVRSYYNTAPATPYTITAAMMVLPAVGATSGSLDFGLIFRNSGDANKIVVFNFEIAPVAISTAGLLYMWVRHWSSATGVSASPMGVSVPFLPSNPFFLRATDNGTNRLYSLSVDGVNFLQVYSEARTTYLTADQVGLGFRCENASSKLGLSLLSWVQS